MIHGRQSPSHLFGAIEPRIQGKLVEEHLLVDIWVTATPLLSLVLRAIRLQSLYGNAGVVRLV
jgi:hypothetical protein